MKIAGSFKGAEDTQKAFNELYARDTLSAGKTLHAAVLKERELAIELSKKSLWFRLSVRLLRPVMRFVMDESYIEGKVTYYAEQVAKGCDPRISGVDTQIIETIKTEVRIAIRESSDELRRAVDTRTQTRELLQ